MRPYDDELTLEELDEQIDWRVRAPRPLPAGQSSPTTQLLQDLRRLYENEQGDEQSVEVVRQRLAENGAVPASPRRRSRPAGSPPSQPNAWQPLLQGDNQPRRRWSLAQRVTAIAAAAVLVVVVGGLAVGLILVRQHNSGTTPRTTATPGQEAVASPTTSATIPPQTLAYIGSDGNVWTMSWPGGSPKQLTTAAQGPGTYSGLAWSPDGSMLAFAKGIGSGASASLIVLKPDGTVVTRVTMQNPLYNSIPFIWSPDSTMIAYRVGGDGTYLPDGTYDGTLVLVDAHTGKTVKTVTYVAGGSGCGGGGPMSDLASELWTVHHVDFGRYGGDVFSWSADQRSMLVTENCSPHGQVGQVDLSTGNISYTVPLQGSYQPGGNLIVGYWNDGTLGLTDLSGNHVRALVKADSQGTQLGFPVWTRDGKAIYYEHDDGIVRIGVDGSNQRQVLAGKAVDSQGNETVLVVPHPSPDGHLLLYLQVTGSTRTPDDGSGTPQPTPTIPLTARWYVAQADGTNPIPLPQGIAEAAWQ
jgi:hypothetical protein